MIRNSLRNENQFFKIVLFSSITAILIIFLFGIQEAFGIDVVSEKMKKFCEDKYETYKKLGSNYFQQKYSHVLYLGECLQLYQDKNWDFAGKSKIDKFYEKQVKLNTNTGLKIRNYDNQNLNITNLGYTKIGNNEFTLKVRLCQYERQISEPKFFVVTDKEYFLALGNLTIKENSCVIVRIYAQSQNPEGVNFIPFNGNYIPSKYMLIKSAH